MLCYFISYESEAGNNHEEPVTAGPALRDTPLQTRDEKSALAAQQAGDLFGIVGQDDIRAGPSD